MQNFPWLLAVTSPSAARQPKWHQSRLSPRSGLMPHVCFSLVTTLHVGTTCYRHSTGLCRDFVFTMSDKCPNGNTLD
jgi:hypothetical protein